MNKSAQEIRGGLTRAIMSLLSNEGSIDIPTRTRLLEALTDIDNRLREIERRTGIRSYDGGE